MDRFSKETGVLFFDGHDYQWGGEGFLCRDFIDTFFHVGRKDRVSFRVTNYPLKEAVKIELTKHVCFDDSFAYHWKQVVTSPPRWVPEGQVYEPLEKWLNSIPRLKKLKNEQTAIIYVSIYIDA